MHHRDVIVTSWQVFKVGEEGGEDDDDDEDSFEAPTRGRGGAGGRTIRSKSIGIQFKESLAELMATISITHPRHGTVYCRYTSIGSMVSVFCQLRLSRNTP